MFINIDNKKVHYEIRGKGKPILFVHGWGGSINSLKAIAKLVADNHKSIILDLPGFGESDNPDKNWGVGEYANLLNTLIDVLKINKIDYFGHSFGGSLGIYLASYHPNLINKLILCDSAYKRRGNVSKSAQLFNKVFQFLPAPDKLKFLVKKIIYKIFFPNSDMMKYPQLESNFKKIMTEDLTPLLGKINAPTLILWGEKDIDTPMVYAYELKEKINNSKLITFKEETHDLPLKKPLEVCQEVKKFI